MALLKDGCLEREELEKLPGVPLAERLGRGPVAVIECAQEIPCNPCVEACHNHAILIDGSLIGLPRLDPDQCSGCGLCIAGCPGQAIFVVDATFSEAEGLVQMPYEFYPLPEEGELVDGLSRCGEKVCEARVLRVLSPRRNDHTPVITLAVPKEWVMEVRSLRMKR